MPLGQTTHGGEDLWGMGGECSAEAEEVLLCLGQAYQGGGVREDQTPL